MKVVIAPDSFKGSASAMEVARAIEAGVKSAVSNVETVLVPVADGGEGTMDSLVSATNGERVSVTVKDPLGREIIAEYGKLGDGKVCVIEMATASGLYLISEEERNPLKTTTYGTGQLIRAALDDGCREFILAVGGSATNDGGIGMLQALGMKLLDGNGEEVGFGGEELDRITMIDHRQFDERISESSFLIASDVQNPFIGPMGASYVFGPQKGATEEVVKLLDEKMEHWANVIADKTGVRLHDKSGAGAAGGIGGAFQAFFPSQMRRGIDIVIEYTGLKEALQGADYVITGEGQIDYQTASGKTPMGVAQEAQADQIPVIVLTGSIGKGIETLYEYGITSIHSIANGPISLATAMEQAKKLLEQKAEQIFRLIAHKQ